MAGSLCQKQDLFFLHIWRIGKYHDLKTSYYEKLDSDRGDIYGCNLPLTTLHLKNAYFLTQDNHFVQQRLYRIEYRKLQKATSNSNISNNMLHNYRATS